MRNNSALPAAEIREMRQRIDEIDDAFIELWRERAQLSQRIGAARVAAGGTRLALRREEEIIHRFRENIGVDGVHLATLLLRAGRGPLLRPKTTVRIPELEKPR